MRNLNARLAAIEREMVRRKGPPGCLIVAQDLDAPTIYRNGDTVYTDAELTEIAKTQTVIRVDYVDDWRNGQTTPQN